MIKVTLKNINIESLISFFTDINIGEKQIVDILDCDGVLTMISRGHTKPKDFVKSVESDLSVMCSDVVSEQSISHLKIPIIDIRKVIELLRIYSKDTDVNINLTCKNVDGVLVAHGFEMKSKKKSTKLKMADISLVQYIPNNVWDGLLSNIEVLSSFELSELDIMDIKKLLRYENESQADLKVKEIRKFRIRFDGESSKVLSYDENWDIDISTVGDYSSDCVFPSILFTNMPSTSVFTCQFVKSTARDVSYLIVSNSDLRTTYVVISGEYKK